MADRQNPVTLYDLARSAAEDAFEADGSRQVNTDKVCAVALHVTDDVVVTLFSGKPGYDKLVQRHVQMRGGSRGAAQTAITANLTAFLKSPDGGGFTDAQIRNKGFAPHGRGAMNCAEPKIFYYITTLRNMNAGNWVLVPFNEDADGNLIYNPPCGNCREWVYAHFHALSRRIAGDYGGQDALASMRP